MKTLLNLEEIATLIFAILLFSFTDIAWWWYAALFLAPDIGMLGYLINTKFGAISYNLFHHKGVAFMVIAAGLYFLDEWLVLTGSVLLGHSAFDRILGYGLKYPDHFKHTHLGWTNNKN
ncbi:DUF4260 domain-containing protein [Gangjinia marincola]|uniref:DUF4260 domain-containing protein n=1 Tax=Gangjinia marincola TaxID=578463 RepID=A0ABN1MFI6_9FLAO